MDRIISCCLINKSNSFFWVHQSRKKFLEEVNLLKKLEFHFIYNKKNLITVSHDLMSEVEALWPIDVRSVQVVGNLIDFAGIREMAEVTLPIVAASKRYVLFVGRICAQKRLDRLIRSFRALVDMDPGLHLVIVGSGNDLSNPYYAEALGLVGVSGLSESVIFVGSSSNPYVYMKYAECLILTSDFEGLPTVLLEALSLNLPVVSVPCPTGPVELLQDIFPDGLVGSFDPCEIAMRVHAVGGQTFSFEDSVQNFCESWALNPLRKLLNVK